MKRPKFLMIWLIVLLLLSIALTVDSLTYLPFIFFTKSYISLLGILAGFGQIWGVIELLRWRKMGVTFLVSSAVVIFLVTGINEFYVKTNMNQILISMIMVLVANTIMFGILYFAIKPVWKKFK